MLAHRGISHNWILLLVGAYLLIEGLRGLATGSTLLFYRTVKRSEDGYLYWFAVGTGVIVGGACVVHSFLMLTPF